MGIHKLFSRFQNLLDFLGDMKHKIFWQDKENSISLHNSFFLIDACLSELTTNRIFLCCKHNTESLASTACTQCDRGDFPLCLYSGATWWYLCLGNGICNDAVPRSGEEDIFLPLHKHMEIHLISLYMQIHCAKENQTQSILSSFGFCSMKCYHASLEKRKIKRHEPFIVVENNVNSICQNEKYMLMFQKVLFSYLHS